MHAHSFCHIFKVVHMHSSVFLHLSHYETGHTISTPTVSYEGMEKHQKSPVPISILLPDPSQRKAEAEWLA